MLVINSSPKAFNIYYIVEADVCQSGEEEKGNFFCFYGNNYSTNSSQNCFIFTMFTWLTFYLFLHDLHHYDFSRFPASAIFHIVRKCLPDWHSFYAHFFRTGTFKYFFSVSLSEIEKFQFTSNFFHNEVR